MLRFRLVSGADALLFCRTLGLHLKAGVSAVSTSANKLLAALYRYY